MHQILHNTGIKSILKALGRFCYKPQKKVYERLKANVNLNHIKNVMLLNNALYSKPAKVKMGISKWGDAESSIDYKESVRYEEVAAITLDSICKYPDVIIDVEGYELEVLEGAKQSLKHVKHIIFEQNVRRLVERNMDPNSVINYLKSKGFNIQDTESNERIDDYRDASGIGSNFYATK